MATVAQKQAKRRRSRNTLSRQEHNFQKSGKYKCKYKFRYEDFLTAMQAADIMSKKEARPFIPYLCNHCEYAHIGSARSATGEVVLMMEGYTYKIPCPTFTSEVIP